MAEPKKRLTSTRSGNRQSKDALKASALISCSNCKARIAPHRVCANCGYYKGEKVITLKSDMKAKKKIAEQIEEDKNE